MRNLFHPSMIPQPSTLHPSKLPNQTDQESTNTITYPHKRNYILNFIQKFSEKLKLSREGCGIAQMCTDELYRTIEYSSQNTKCNLVALLMIASKITDRLILLPKTLSYIFSISQEKIQKSEEEIYDIVSHMCLEPSYPALINFYLHQWGNKLHISFFQEDQLPYFLFRSVHFYGETIYKEEWKLQPAHIFQIMFFVLKSHCKCEKELYSELKGVFGEMEQNMQEMRLWEQAEKWNEGRRGVELTFEKRKEFKCYNEFLGRYFR